MTKILKAMMLTLAEIILFQVDRLNSLHMNHTKPTLNQLYFFGMMIVRDDLCSCFFNVMFSTYIILLEKYSDWYDNILQELTHMPCIVTLVSIGL